jgi:DNA polymerase-3 subunit gamma/tau
MMDIPMPKALYNKWRPQKWDDVVGQQHIVQTLRNSIIGSRVVHAYLFAGPRGTGKTTTARLLAKAVNCLNQDLAARPCNECAHCLAVNEGRFLDLIEIDAASNTGVDDIRDLRDKINFSPNQGAFKVYIIDEVHMLSTQAFNALLKTLEEPPAHAIFILATTEMQKIPATVLSRCQRHEFRRVPVDDIVAQLKRIVESEKLIAEPDALGLIARQSAGGMRDAISLLDQMASTGKEITLERTQSVLGTATSQVIIDLVTAAQDQKPSDGMNALHTALDSGTDPRLLARQVVDYLRSILLLQMGNGSQVELALDVRAQAEKHAKAFSQSDVLRMIKSFNNAAMDLRGSWQPSLPLELAFVEIIGVAVNSDPKSTKSEQLPQAVHSEKIDQKITEKPSILQRNKNLTVEKEVGESTPAGPVITLGQLNKVWKQISSEVNIVDKSQGALLNSCQLLEIKNDILALGFGSEILRSKADTPEFLENTHKAIAKVVGVNLSIKCVVSTAKHTAPPDIKADGMVAAALKAGGEIVDVQD